MLHKLTMRKSVRHGNAFRVAVNCHISSHCELEMTDTGVTDHYLDAIWLEHGLSENTVAAYCCDLNAVNKWVFQQRNTTLLNSSGEDLRDYLAVRFQRRGSARSVARVLSALRGFFAHCESE